MSINTLHKGDDDDDNNGNNNNNNNNNYYYYYYYKWETFSTVSGRMELVHRHISLDFSFV